MDPLDLGGGIDMSQPLLPEDLASILHAIAATKAGLPSRERSLAVTKLEEALFWLNHDYHLRKQDAS